MGFELEVAFRTVRGQLNNLPVATESDFAGIRKAPSPAREISCRCFGAPDPDIRLQVPTTLNWASGSGSGSSHRVDLCTRSPVTSLLLQSCITAYRRNGDNPSYPLWTMSDRGYINLVRHLTRTTSTLPLETIQASIAHYLARPPIPVPGSPTPLAATILGSPLFRPYTYQKLTTLSVAFRHAVHLRFAVHKEEADKNPGGLLTRGVDVTRRLGKWTKAVLEGFRGRVALVRLACASGLLLGLEDWEVELEVKKKDAKARARVEEEVVLAIAEVMDAYTGEGSGWETDFQRIVDANEEADGGSSVDSQNKYIIEDSMVTFQPDFVSVAVLLVAQCASFVDPQRLQALPLPVRPGSWLRRLAYAYSACRQL